MLSQIEIIIISISTGLLAMGAGMVWLYFKYRRIANGVKTVNRLSVVNVPHPPMIHKVRKLTPTLKRKA